MSNETHECPNPANFSVARDEPWTCACGAVWQWDQGWKKGLESKDPFVEFADAFAQIRGLISVLSDSRSHALCREMDRWAAKHPRFGVKPQFTDEEWLAAEATISLDDALVALMSEDPIEWLRELASPCVMDHPDGPKCRCGEPSTLECGLCQKCALADLKEMDDENNG